MEQVIIDWITEGKDGKKKLILIAPVQDVKDQKHLTQLQERIDACLVAINSHQLDAYFPTANNGYVIRVLYKYKTDDICLSFFSQIQKLVESKGCDFEYALYKDSSCLFE